MCACHVIVSGEQSRTFKNPYRKWSIDTLDIASRSFRSSHMRDRKPDLPIVRICRRPSATCEAENYSCNDTFCVLIRGKNNKVGSASVP